MRRETYKKEIGLQDNEIPARKDLETGKYTDMPGRKNNIPKGKTLVNQKDFSKVNNKVIPFLKDNLSNTVKAVSFDRGFKLLVLNSVSPII